jgi:dTDP-4-dehydrorhamnose 3,5-epimerase
MSVQVRHLDLEGVLEIVPPRFRDERGFFSETYNAEDLARAGVDIPFVQDNHSYSAARGVLRGLHYQLPPVAQDKLVRVIRGSIYDVAVDIRRSSPNFGRWTALVLSADAWNQILVPRGYAHGFVTLEEHTEVFYKVSAPYSQKHDRTIRFDDPEVGIEWPLPAGDAVISEKDRSAPYLAAAELFD